MCERDIGCVCTITVDADVYTGEVELENRLEEAAAGPIASGADDVMAYEATDGPLAGITILIERWNGKGFNSVMFSHADEDRAGRVAEFVKTYIAERARGALFLDRRAGGWQLRAFGKKKKVENLIVKGLIAWHAIEQFKGWPPRDYTLEQWRDLTADQKAGNIGDPFIGAAPVLVKDEPK